ncbi:hypothetical protein D9M72_435640 [compost metagenome]
MVHHLGNQMTCEPLAEAREGLVIGAHGRLQEPPGAFLYGQSQRDPGQELVEMATPLEVVRAVGVFKVPPGSRPGRRDSLDGPLGQALAPV